MVAKRRSPKANLAAADALERASAPAPDSTSTPTTVSDSGLSSNDIVPNKDAKNSTISEVPAADAVDVPQTPSDEPTIANGAGKKQQSTLPKGKKRVLPESASEQQSAIKKTKECPQWTFKSPAKPEGSPVAESSSGPLGQSDASKDEQKWQGFCEIENEPAFFSVILREIGVQNVTVRQVLMLDPDILATMPNPIFGLVLCFRHRNFDVVHQEEACPSDIWFANQMPAQNSCATLAMIHTLLNTDNKNVEIGEHMRQFKIYSRDLDPFYRGQAFASWQFVKDVHNSFAKKMDIYKDDLVLDNKVKKVHKIKLKPTPKGKRAAPKKRRDSEDSEDSTNSDVSQGSFEDSAQHYIAFVPKDGNVWKLDGIDPFPTRIGTYDEAGGESWTDAVSDRIQALMAAGGDAEYSVFAIAQSPLVGLRKNIIETDNTIKAVSHRLDDLSADWHGFVPEEDIEPPSPSWLGSFTDEDRKTFPVPDEIQEEIDEEDMANLLTRRTELVAEFRRLVTAWTMEETNETDETDAARKRRFDMGPLVKRWLEMLAENGQLEALASEFPAR